MRNSSSGEVLAGSGKLAETWTQGALGGQVTLMTTVWRPVAPFGSGTWRTVVWV
jgi:hypothetical protein